jgi:glyoxylase-like metal-dependent hydrolase (beta-lactamase superfamily II)
VSTFAKKNPKAPSAKKATARTAAETEQRAVTIRMYRHGLGDCFLLGLPSKEKEKTFWMMIDCGVVLATADRTGEFKKLIADVKETLGRDPIDILVVTHEHYDHISGFSHVKAEFEAIKVREVWFAWR